MAFATRHSQISRGNQQGQQEMMGKDLILLHFCKGWWAFGLYKGHGRYTLEDRVPNTPSFSTRRLATKYYKENLQPDGWNLLNLDR